jgi:hypothetical protein
MCLDDNVFNILWKCVKYFVMNLMRIKLIQNHSLNTLTNVFTIYLNF